MAGIVANAVAAALVPRQTATGSISFPESTETPPPGFVEQNGRFVPFWYTRTGIIVKWSLFLGLFALFALYVFLGYTHAKRRIRRGLRPLAYHRWLVSRSELARVDPRFAYPQPAGYTTYRPDQNYGMQTMPPPPVYDPSRPPAYVGPPEGGSKVAPSQWVDQPAHRPASSNSNGGGGNGDGDGDYEAPPGPPPGVAANQTGSSNPYRA